MVSLGLRDPKYFIVREIVPGITGSHRVISESFSMPANLAVSINSFPLLDGFYKGRRKGTHGCL